VWLSGTADKARPAQEHVLTTEQDARASLAQLADEQAALRRVATLVAAQAAPDDIHAAVAEEVALLLAAHRCAVGRYEPDETLTVTGYWSMDGTDLPIGTQIPLEGDVVTATIRQSGRPMRIDTFDDLSGPVVDYAREVGPLPPSTVGAPIVVDGQAWGVVFVSSMTDPLPGDAESRVVLFTELVATAIANADSRSALRELAEEQAALRRVATLVAQQPSPEEIFEVVSVEVARVFGFDADPTSPDLAGVVRFEPGPALVAVGASKLGEAVKLGVRVPTDELYVSSHVLRTGRSARIGADDLDSVGGATADWFRHYGLLSQVGSPIVVEGRLWGAMTVNSGNDFPADTEERLERFTELIATAIANAESHDALARLADEQAALRRVATLVARGIGPEGVFRAVASEVGQLFGADVAAIVRFEDDGTVTVLGDVGGPHVSGKRVSLDEGYVVHRVRETGDSSRFDTDDPSAADMPSLVRTLGIRSSVASPIVVEGALWGAITAASVGDPLPSSAERRLTEFTELVATAVANTHAREEVNALADEQAALRRIATLVAGGAEPEQVFAAVTEAVAATFDAVTAVMRFEHDPPGKVMVGLSEEGDIPIGTRWPLGEGVLSTEVYRTGQTARFDAVEAAHARPVAGAGFRVGVPSQVACPILVEGSLWGVITLNAERELAPDTEQRLEKFIELVTIAIANTETRLALRTAADEQGALRRVATLVAGSSSPSDVFVAVTYEIALVLGADAAMLCRADPDGAAVVVGTWADGTPEPAYGTRIPPGGRNLTTIVLETGRAARIDSYGDGEATGYASEFARTYGLRSAVGAPIHAEGRLWGLVVAGTTRDEPLPQDAEERLDGFTELIATAISNAQAHEDLASLAEQQAALRRVATLVARRVAPEVVFRAVAEEAGGLLGAEVSGIVRLENDDTGTVMAGPSPGPYVVGERVPLDPHFVVHAVRETGRPARFETDDPTAEGMPDLVRRLGFRSAVASPIVVEGAIWGAVVLGSSGASFPPETEQRLDEFTELVATAISNATARADLVASRARIVFAGDEARRRIERNLHDGTQQRLIALGLDLQRARAAIPDDQLETHSELVGVEQDLEAILVDLRELSHGLHPSLLSRLGLGPSLQALARRSPIPVHLDVDLPERPAAPLETAMYYVVSEALTNAIKHSHASEISVTITTGEKLAVSIVDDGVGGADPSGGSGLTGLLDRIDALGGRFALESPPRGGTRISIELPVEPTVAS
jgi:GAF domain-containing protein